MSGAKFGRLAQKLIFALCSKEALCDEQLLIGFFFSKEKGATSGQQLVSGKLGADCNFGATLKSTSLILKRCCPGQSFICGWEDVERGEMELWLLVGNDHVEPRPARGPDPHERGKINAKYMFFTDGTK